MKPRKTNKRNREEQRKQPSLGRNKLLNQMNKNIKKRKSLRKILQELIELAQHTWIGYLTDSV